MATAPTVKTKRLTRDQIAAFVGNNPRAVKLIENLSSDVETTLPDAAFANAQAAEAAQAAAVSAAEDADAAAIAAAHAQSTADAALAATVLPLLDPGWGAIRAELAQLRDRIAALEQGATR